MSHQLLGKFILSGKIRCITGLHIGGTTAGIEIGGVDNPVIKDPVTDQPYIPGSAMKGKLRSLTEWSLGLIKKHKDHGSYQAYDCEELGNPPPTEKEPYERYQKVSILGRLFGASSNDENVRYTAGPTRLTVRDSFLNGDSIEDLRIALGAGLFTEVKTENTLDRITSEANPRPIERVPAGSAFDFTMIIDIYEQSDLDLMHELFASMHLLEHSSLGGSGSRGHGQIKFEAVQLSWRSLKYYREGEHAFAVQLPGDKLEPIIKDFQSIQWPPL